MEVRGVNLLANKGGSGGYTYRATLPVDWIRAMGLNEENRELVLAFNGKEIIIKNKKELDNMKLELYLMTLEEEIKLKMKGKLVDKRLEDDRMIDKTTVKGERITVIGQQNLKVYKEKWEIEKTNGEVFELNLERHILNYKGNITEEIFEDFFSDKIVYEEVSLEDLKEYGEIEIV